VLFHLLKQLPTSLKSEEVWAGDLILVLKKKYNIL